MHHIPKDFKAGESIIVGGQHGSIVVAHNGLDADQAFDDEVLHALPDAFPLIPLKSKDGIGLDWARSERKACCFKGGAGRNLARLPPHGLPPNWLLLRPHRNRACLGVTYVQWMPGEFLSLCKRVLYVYLAHAPMYTLCLLACLCACESGSVRVRVMNKRASLYLPFQVAGKLGQGPFAGSSFCLCLRFVARNKALVVLVNLGVAKVQASKPFSLLPPDVFSLNACFYF